MDENTKFEYNIITRDKMFPMSSAELNGYGTVRWQLVQIISRDNQLVELTDEFEKRASYVFDELDKHNILSGKFYTNKMDPISIDNITKDSVTISYFDNGYDIRDSREIELPIKVFLDDAELAKYINDKITEKTRAAEERKLQQELEQQEREYCEYIRLKQKFEQN